jgi:hypothetical protein
MKYDFEKNLEAKQARRMKAEDRFLTRLEKREAEAHHLVGELNSGKCYINVRNKNGQLTGKEVYFEGTFAYGNAIEYLLRNNYV